VKTNPDKRCAAVIGNVPWLDKMSGQGVGVGTSGSSCKNVGFDVASPTEIQLGRDAIGCKNVKERLLYANPQKKKESIIDAINAGVRRMTFDTMEEAEKIYSCLDGLESFDCGGSGIELLLRIAVPDGKSRVPLSVKFGCSVEGASDLIKAARSKFDETRMRIVGISFHCGSGCEDGDAFVGAVEICRRIFDQVGGLELLDIGGGFPGVTGGGEDDDLRFEFRSAVKEECRDRDDSNGGDNEKGNTKIMGESFIAISEKLRPALEKNFPRGEGQVEVIAEPGRFFFEGAFIFMARIYSKEKFSSDSGGVERVYWIGDGIEGIFRDVVLVGESFDPVPLFFEEGGDIEGSVKLTLERNKKPSGQLYDSIVRGPSNDLNDIVARKMLPELENGSYLLVDRVGAYTLSIASRDKNYEVVYLNE